MTNLELSNLPKTYIFDIDGTILEHCGGKDGIDKILPGVKEFWDKYITPQDKVILLTARNREWADKTKQLLNENGIIFNFMIAGLPVGERIQFNDIKPEGLLTAHAVNLKRDRGLSEVEISFSDVGTILY